MNLGIETVVNKFPFTSRIKEPRGGETAKMMGNILQRRLHDLGNVTN